MAVTPLLGIGVKVEVQKTLGANKVITAITAASPPVVTSAAHGLANGDVVVLSGIVGMVQLNGLACRIANIATNTFELEGVVGTAFSTYVSGGVANQVATWDTIGWAKDLNMAGGSPAELDTTGISDLQTQSVYGMSAAGSGSIDGFDQIADVAMANLRGASNNSQTRAFRLTWSGGQKRIFNSNVSAGGGFTASANAVGTMSCAVTVRGQINEYAS